MRHSGAWIDGSGKHLYIKSISNCLILAFLLTLGVFNSVDNKDSGGEKKQEVH